VFRKYSAYVVYHVAYSIWYVSNGVAQWMFDVSAKLQGSGEGPWEG
jgi:hypothetical protein